MKTGSVLHCALLMVCAAVTDAAEILSGEAPQSSLATGSSENWTINANTGDYIMFRIANVSATDNYTLTITLRNPANVQLVTTNSSTDAWIYFRATTSGVHTLMVAASTGSTSGRTGTYSLHCLKIPGDTVVPGGDEGGTLVNGGQHDGAFTLGDLDAWTINATVGDYLLFRVGKLSGSTNSAVNIRLFGPDGALLLSDFGAADAGVSQRTTQSGIYTVVISGNYSGDTGSYRLRCLKVPGESIIPDGDEGGTLVSGSAHTGTITRADMDSWTCSASAGDTLIMRVASNITNGIYGYALDAFAPDGSLLAGTLTGTYSPNSGLGNEVTYQATLSGTYTFVVSAGGDDGTGDYSLQFLRIPGTSVVPVGDEGGDVTNGDNYTASIPEGDMDAWSVPLQAGQWVLLRLATVSGDGTFTPRMRLFSPAGVVVGDGGADSDTFVLYRAVTTGNHILVVADGSTTGRGTGLYSLRPILVPGTPLVPAGDEGGVLQSGVESQGTITLGDLDAWRVSALAGDTLNFQLNRMNTTITPFLILFGPDGAGLDSNYGTGAVNITYHTTTAGLYTVVVGANNIGGSGDYRLSVTGATGPIPPSIVTPPVAQSVLAGGTASFSVVANGTATLTYQWLHNGHERNGATGSTLTLDDVSTLDAGSYTVTVSNAAGSVTSISVELTVLATFADWRAGEFSAEELADSDISGPDADPDGDGLRNLVEYALGLEPKVANASGLPEMGTMATDWIYTYTRPVDRTDITYAVEISNDLTMWTTLHVTTHELVSSVNGIETWRAKYPLSATNLFFRLKVTQN